MNPPSALAGTTQIPVHCNECNITVTKWMNQGKNIDNSITFFREDLLALTLTYDRLASTLKDDFTVQAARTTNQHAGRQLWSQLSLALGNCQNVILGVRQVLQSIEYTSRRMSTIVKQLSEALNGGDLVIVKDAIKLFDQNIAFPVAMISITLQVEDAGSYDGAYANVLADLRMLKGDHDAFLSRVRRFLADPRSADMKAFRNMQDFSETVSIFMTNVANIIQQSSAASLRNFDIDNNYQDQTHVDTPKLETQLPLNDANPMQERPPILPPVSPAEVLDVHGILTQPTFDDTEPETIEDDYGSDEDEIEVELIREYMANGTADLEVDDFAGAEDNFRRALEMAEENEVSKTTGFSPGDITLLLGDCLMKQDKEEEALEVLEPLADGTATFTRPSDDASVAGSVRPGTEQSSQYTANHVLGAVFLKRGDFPVAEKRAKNAFKGRRKVLGASNPSTLESVQLIIDIYVAKDDKVNARAYRRFLEPLAKGRPSMGSRTESIETITARARSPAVPIARQVQQNLTVANDTSNGRASPLARSTIPNDTTAMTPALSNPRPSIESQAPAYSQFPEPSPAASLYITPPPPVPSEEIQPIPTYAYGQAPPPPPKSPSRMLPNQNRPLDQIKENDSGQLVESPTDTKGPNSQGPSGSQIEPDPMPANISTATSNTKKKMSWSSVFSNRTKPETNLTKKTSADSTPPDASRDSSVTAFSVPPDTKRSMSLAGGFGFDGTRSILSKFSDYGDDKASITSRSFSVSTHPPVRTRQELAPRFAAIKQLRGEGKKGVAIDTAIKLLREYDPDRKVIMIREAELKKNIRESHKAMAGTGYGYSTIHFFSERRIEANIEIELLIEQGVDVNAIAYKAGVPGTDPFTPLQRACELGHAEIVRLLIDADVSLDPPKQQKATSGIATQEQLFHPLLISCARGHTQIAYILLEAGAGKLMRDFPQRLWHGNSLLHEACWHVNIDMVKMLLDYSAAIKQQHRQSNNGQPDYESGIIGSPGQQDQFGATPIMYAIDMRDCTTDRARRTKTKNRKECLRLLIEHNINREGVNSTTYRESVARMLSLKWSKGPGLGHSIFCYADEAGDEELTRFLDPFRYQVSPGTRCSAIPQCSATLRSNLMASGSVRSNGEPTGRQVRLPSFPELMSTPVENPEAEARSERESWKSRIPDGIFGSPRSEIGSGSDGVDTARTFSVVSQPSAGTASDR